MERWGFGKKRIKAGAGKGVLKRGLLEGSRGPPIAGNPQGVRGRFLREDNAGFARGLKRKRSTVWMGLNAVRLPDLL